MFGAAAYRGNPLAVVLDAEGLDTADMQRFAAWTDLSETTFVLPSGAADYRVRIFTPTRELPFAGHPTLGTAHAWLEATGARPVGDRVVQECGAGLVAVRVTAAGLAFAAPPTVRSGPVEEQLVDRIAAALGVRRDDIVAAEWVDNGPGWVAVLLGSAEQVLAVRPSFLDADLGVVGPYPDGAEYAIEVRALLPKNGMVDEDPVTGSLNASVAQWLLRSGRLTAPYVAHQGTARDRDGRVHVSQDADGQVWIAGATTTCMRGDVLL